jgi:3-hydroxyacyl-[acyl-carrier-protein] dehydratase
MPARDEGGEPGRERAIPLSAIDAVLECSSTGIVSRKSVFAAEPFFAGHYPGFPIFPGVFILEGVYQAIARYLDRQGLRGRLAEIRSAQFVSAVLPGSVLEFDCRCRREGRRLEVDARCRNGPVLAASVRLAYTLDARDDA